MITIREAVTADNGQLLGLFHSAPMPGHISLRSERTPDFFEVTRLRGDTTVLVAEDEMKRLVGCFSVTFFESALEGKNFRIAYLGDIRVNAEHRGSRTSHYLTRAVHDIAMGASTDLYYCVMSEGNERAATFMSGRLGMPAFESLGSFILHQMLPLTTRSAKTYLIESARSDDRSELARLRTEFNSRYALVPFPTKRISEQTGSHGLCEESLIGRKDGRIVASVTLAQIPSKQYTVLGLPTPLRLALSSVRGIGRVVPLPPVPKIGAPFSMLYVRDWSFAKGHELALQALLKHGRTVASSRGLAFLSLGLHERDPLNAFIPKIGRFKFVSTAWGAGSPDLIAAIRRHIPMQDFSLV